MNTQSLFTTNQAEEDSQRGTGGGLRNFLELALHSFNKSFFFLNACIRQQLDPKGTKQ